MPTDIKPSCRAPGHTCVDVLDCYTSKGCQYAPDDSDAPGQRAPYETTQRPIENSYFTINPETGGFDMVVDGRTVYSGQSDNFKFAPPQVIRFTVKLDDGVMKNPTPVVKLDGP